MSKTCKNCNLEKDLENFSPSKKGLLGRRSNCKKCQAQIARQKRLENPEASRAAIKKYRLSHPEVIAARDARYYQKHKEVLREKTKQWRKNNPDKYAEHNRAKEHRRRARKFENGMEDYTEQMVIEAYGADCHICDGPINLEAPRRVGTEGWELGLHLDHVVPLSKGGDDRIENLRPTHGMCNLKKTDTI